MDIDMEKWLADADQDSVCPPTHECVEVVSDGLPWPFCKYCGEWLLDESQIV
jgi:hypothetical protein